jgi:hypothetical protein
MQQSNWLEKPIMLHSLTAGHTGVTATAAAIALSVYRVSIVKIANNSSGLTANSASVCFILEPDVIDSMTMSAPMPE